MYNPNKAELNEPQVDDPTKAVEIVETDENVQEAEGNNKHKRKHDVWYSVNKILKQRKAGQKKTIFG